MLKLPYDKPYMSLPLLQGLRGARNASLFCVVIVAECWPACRCRPHPAAPWAPSTRASSIQWRWATPPSPSSNVTRTSSPLALAHKALSGKSQDSRTAIFISRHLTRQDGPLNQGWLHDFVSLRVLPLYALLALAADFCPCYNSQQLFISLSYLAGFMVLTYRLPD